MQTGRLNEASLPRTIPDDFKGRCHQRADGARQAGRQAGTISLSGFFGSSDRWSVETARVMDSDSHKRLTSQEIFHCHSPHKIFSSQIERDNTNATKLPIIDHYNYTPKINSAYPTPTLKPK